MSSPQRKKILFKEFVRENESKFTGKYPFLTTSQIHAKLKNSWKKVCQKKEENKVKKSPGTSDNNSDDHSESCTQADSRARWGVGPSSDSPLVALAGKENDIDDSGGWYDESAADSTTENTCINEHGPDEMSRSDSLTEETVNDVMTHTLNIEMKGECCENEANAIKGEKILSGLFHPMRKLQNGDCASKQSRLLASENTEGKSNFSGMFHEKENIFYKNIIN